MRVIIFIVFFAFLSGCSNTQKEPVKVVDKRNFYLKAFDHGCSTKKGKFKKNKKRYIENITYKEGWDKGFLYCEKDIRPISNIQGYQDGYNTAKTGKVIIRDKNNKEYKESFKRGYYNFLKNN